LRLTIDSDLSARAADGWQVPASLLDGQSLFDGQRIVELKFRETLPTLFRGLIQDLRLEPASFSKYRTSAAACFAPALLAIEHAAPPQPVPLLAPGEGWGERRPAAHA
jgi:hypothetical protein